jgi:ATP-dependent helicase/nuclease subunit B
LRFVRGGGRFREVTVLVRDLEAYHAALQRAFARYEIPCFMDRRESVAHHPLAELTRSAMRAVARDWRHEDWFAALKSGLVPADEQEIDRLENEALAHGWQGSATWLQPLSPAESPVAVDSFEKLRQKLVPPFERLALALGGRQGRPRGSELASALRAFWQALDVGSQLEAWAEAMPEVAPGVWPADKTGAVHRTVWEQMNGWLDNLGDAFPDEALPLAEWLPILDAGLGSLTVGVIPPALDQVRIGAVNRSRNPDVQLALVLGLNEGVFPARPATSPLLTDAELDTLANHGVALSSLPLRQIGREHHFGYVACTRARRQLVLTAARCDLEGKPLNLSPFVTRLKTLFPELEIEGVPRSAGLPPALDAGQTRSRPPAGVPEPVHVHELIPQLLALPEWPGEAVAANGGRSADSQVRRVTDFPAGDPSAPAHPADLEVAGTAGLENCATKSAPSGQAGGPGSTLQRFNALASSLAHLRNYATVVAQDRLNPELAAGLYGPALRTSVSRLEQFAACAFKFFIYAGLRAEERVLFELDPREQGSFQHEVLAAFHEQLRQEGKCWRDLTPAGARERVGRIAAALAAAFREGLFSVSGQSRFTARMLAGALQDFVEVLVGWMRGQYAFDPVAVELGFGEPDGAPAWTLELGDGRQLALRGRIDRVDLCRSTGGDHALCVVVDYKSSQKELDPVLLANGVQLQLPAYLNVLQHWSDPQTVFGVGRLRPAGVFYVSLRGGYTREANRRDALADTDEARRLAYQHAGRFDASALAALDNRGAPKGDQFNYRRNKDGSLAKSCREALVPAAFAALLRDTEENLKRMGREIFAGAARVDPYCHKGAVACDQCAYQAICRIDPWTHRYRVLRPGTTGATAVIPF